MTTDDYQSSLKEQLRLLDYAYNYSSKDFNIDMFIYMLNSSYIFLSNYKVNNRFNKIKLIVSSKINYILNSCLLNNCHC